MRGNLPILPHLQGYYYGFVCGPRQFALNKLVLSTADLTTLRSLGLTLPLPPNDISHWDIPTLFPQPDDRIDQCKLQNFSLDYGNRDLGSAVARDLRDCLTRLIHAAPNLRSVHLTRGLQSMEVLQALGRLPSLEDLTLVDWTASTMGVETTDPSLTSFPALLTLYVEKGLLRWFLPGFRSSSTNAPPVRALTLRHDFKPQIAPSEGGGWANTVFTAITSYQQTLRYLFVEVDLRGFHPASIATHLAPIRACAGLRTVIGVGHDSMEPYELDTLIESLPLLAVFEWRLKGQHAPLSLKTLSAMSINCKHLRRVEISINVSKSQEFRGDLSYSKLGRLKQMVVGRWSIDGSDAVGLASVLRALSPSPLSVSKWIKGIPKDNRRPIWERTVALAEWGPIGTGEVEG